MVSLRKLLNIIQQKQPKCFPTNFHSMIIKLSEANKQTTTTTTKRKLLYHRTSDFIVHTENVPNE